MEAQVSLSVSQHRRAAHVIQHSIVGANTSNWGATASYSFSFSETGIDLYREGACLPSEAQHALMDQIVPLLTECGGGTREGLCSASSVQRHSWPKFVVWP